MDGLISHEHLPNTPENAASAMENFLRVARLALRRRGTFALAALTSLLVALLWGFNLGLVKPIIELTFSPLPPHAYLDQLIDNENERQTLLAKQLTELAADDNSTRSRLQHELDDAKGWSSWLSSLVPPLKRVLPNHSFQALALLVGILFVATLVKDSLLVANMMLVERLSQLAVFDVRRNLFRTILKADVADLGDDRSTGLLTRFSTDLASLANGLNMLLGRVLLEPLKVIACLAGAAMISWRLLLMSLLLAPVAIFLVSRLSQSIKRANRRALDDSQSMLGMISEAIVGMFAVRAFGMEAYERRRLHEHNKRAYHRSMRIAFYSALGRAMIELMAVAIIGMAMLSGAYLVMNQQTTIFGIPIMDEPLSLGSLMAFYALLAGVTDPARKLSEVINFLQRGYASADRIFDVLDRPPSIVERPKPIRAIPSRPTLVLDKVSFAYEPEQRVLKELSLTIPFGQTVALVGPNGCGKSTLLNLLPRFYDPIEGSIRLGDHDLRDLHLHSLRRRIGVVAQSALLFDDTVMANIRYGSHRATDAEVYAAAEKAFAHRFIEQKLADGYQTVVGERGSALSGGQRQRILLARAILRNPEFLLLDEATSQVDLESEQLIHKVLEEFRKGRTTIMITHRLSSLSLADRIVVMDGGQIIDQGTHEQLLESCPFYVRLQQSQGLHIPSSRVA